MNEPDAKLPLNLGRVLSVFLLLPVVLGLERWAFWGARSMLPLHLMDAVGMTREEMGTLLSVQAGLGTLALLVGGALAIATGPAPTLALGALLSIAGYAGLAAASSAPAIWAALLVLALGQGLLKPSAMALAVVELPHPRSHLRAAALVVLYATTNVSALAAGPAASAVARQVGFRAAFVSSAVMATLAALLAVVFAALWYALRAKAPEEAQERLEPRKVALGGLVIVLALAPYQMLISLHSSVAMDLAYKGSSAVSVGTIAGLNPVAVLISAFVVLACLVAFHSMRLGSHTLYAIGGGLSLTAFAMIPLLLSGGSLVAIGTSEVAVGVAEVLVTPFALSRIAGDLPPRFAALGVAVYQSVAALLGLAATALRGALVGAGPLMVGVAALVVLVVGIATFAAAAPLKRALYTPSGA